MKIKLHFQNKTFQTLKAPCSSETYPTYFHTVDIILSTGYVCNASFSVSVGC